MKELIDSWHDAERALSRISNLERRIVRMRRGADERIARIEERLGEECAGLRSEMQTLRQELEGFFRENSNGLRSRSLPSGRIGFRNVVNLEIARPHVTLKRLARHGLGDCIRVKQEIDRQALRRLDERTLHGLGVKRVAEEVFYLSTARGDE